MVRELSWTTIETPAGSLSAGVSDAGLAAVRFGGPPARTPSRRPDGPASRPDKDTQDQHRPNTGRPDTDTQDQHRPNTGRPDKDTQDQHRPNTGRPDTDAPGTDAPGTDARDHVLAATRAQLAEYFAGQRRSFELPIDWADFSPLQYQVLSVLFDSVRYGETITYGGLARRAGVGTDVTELPARAIGRIMGSNPVPVIVPCHRVVAGNGLGGFSGGIGPELKRWLLIFEGALPPTLDWTPAGLPG